MKKPSRKVREDAALICAIAASNASHSCNYLSIREDAGLSYEAKELALDAWQHVVDSRSFYSGLGLYGIDAEAEALLREGWCP